MEILTGVCRGGVRGVGWSGGGVEKVTGRGVGGVERFKGGRGKERNGGGGGED